MSEILELLDTICKIPIDLGTIIAFIIGYIVRGHI